MIEKSLRNARIWHVYALYAVLLQELIRFLLTDNCRVWVIRQRVGLRKAVAGHDRPLFKSLLKGRKQRFAKPCWRVANWLVNSLSRIICVNWHVIVLIAGRSGKC